MNFFKLRIIALIIFLSTNCVAQLGLTSKNAMVVSARQEASDIGVLIMKQGGNAFDAMAATELALAVAYPYAGNIGGGGFMVYRLNNGETGALDYRERAPKAAHANMYLDKDGNFNSALSTEGALSVGIPGTIAGVFEAHKRFGRLPFEKIIKPVIALAKKGVIVTEKQSRQFETYKADINRVSGGNKQFKRAFISGDYIKYPALALTLERIMKHGPDEFYKGQTAKKLVAFLKKRGGIISLEDLADYKAVWRKPTVFQYKDLNIIAMSPPSSGGITLSQIMGMIEPYNISRFTHNGLQSIQLLTEAERRAYADRNHFLGDPDFVKIPVSQMMSKKYIHSRMADFSFDRATPSSAVSHGGVMMTESDETTHYSITDAFGNAVSVTTTLNGAFGSKLYIEELGFFLNNEMDDFSAKPGAANSYGLTGSEANSIFAGKRMLSSMTPTIVEKDSKLLMVLGSPGGSTIITSVLQTILNVYEYRMGMQEAVDAPRFHHQWLPDEILIEPIGFPDSIISELQARGYKISRCYAPVIGKVDAILKLPDGSFEAGADHRGDDAAAGY